MGPRTKKENAKMTYSKCPNCGTLHTIGRGRSDRDEVRNVPCRTCRVKGGLSWLAWEAPRRNKYRRR